MKSPFKFLDAYTREDKEIFYGREAETEALYERLFRSNLILLYGASGTGKTSLINCGLGNKFAETDWFPVFIRRNENLMDSIFSAMQHAATTPIPEDATLHEAVLSLFLDTYVPVYLIFDQFEEIFVLGSQEEQQRFFKSIAGLIGNRTPCKILISMREEYIAYLSDFESVVPSVFDNRLRIEKMSLANIESVIKGTAHSFGISIKEPEKTVAAIIDRLREKKQGIDLTNLQVFDRLYRLDLSRQNKDKSKKKQSVFDQALVQRAGVLEDVLGDFLDEQLSQIEKELGKTGVPLDVLFAFVSDDGTNRSINMQKIKDYLLKAKKISNKDVEFCIQKFEERRILRPLEAAAK